VLTVLSLCIQQLSDRYKLAEVSNRCTVASSVVIYTGCTFGNLQRFFRSCFEALNLNINCILAYY
jgi:hypothetical protein